MKKKQAKKAKKIKKSEPRPAKQDSLTKKVRIKVVGVGGGGGNIVSELAKKLKDFSSQKIEFLALNTDLQALNHLNKKVKTVAFGQKQTRGLGTGRDIAVGERAAKEDIEKVKNIFKDDRDLYIIVSSLGGGTGTGASPVFAKVSNELKSTALGIFTLPFSFEGKKRIDLSLEAVERMKEDLNAHLVIPNEKIFSLTKEEIAFTDALDLLNDQLADSLEGLLRTIYSPGLINIDWADIKTILEGKKKIAYLNVAKTKKVENVEEFVRSLVKNKILDYNFSWAENIMFNIESSKDLSLQTLSSISTKIGENSPGARIIFGLTQNPKLKNEVIVTILATGKEEKKEKKKEIKKEIVEPKSRRTAVQIKEEEKKEIEKQEEDEKVFEIPAFLRKK